MCAVHAGGFRRKGGDSQCVVVLVHKEGAGTRLECPWYVGRPFRGNVAYSGSRAACSNTGLWTAFGGSLEPITVAVSVH